MVHRDPDGLRELLRDFRLLELIERETPAEAELRVVALRRGVNRWPEHSRGGPRRNGGSLLLACEAAALLAPGLVEPGLRVLLPPLLEVNVGDDMISRPAHFCSVGLTQTI